MRTLDEHDARLRVLSRDGIAPEIPTAAEAEESMIGRSVALRHVAISSRREHREPSAVARIVLGSCFRLEVLLFVTPINDEQRKAIAKPYPRIA